eukprot:11641246-Karenia_brevis.AAC.1
MFDEVKKVLPVKTGPSVLLKSPDGLVSTSFAQHKQHFRNYFAGLLDADTVSYADHIDNIRSKKGAGHSQ